MGYLLQNGGLGMAGDWIITGGRPLQGRVEVPAAKNSVLPLLAASLLCSGPVRLQNVPRLTDVEDCLALLRGVGCTQAGRAQNWRCRDSLCAPTLHRRPQAGCVHLSCSVRRCWRGWGG